MRTFFLDFLPRLKRMDKKLNLVTTVTSRTWVLVQEGSASKVAFLFGDDNVLRLSENGKIVRGKWLYLLQGSLEIELYDTAYLFVPIIPQDDILILNLHDTSECVVLVDEKRYSKEIASLGQLKEYLAKAETQRTFPSTVAKKIKILPDTIFNPDDYGDLATEVASLKKQLQSYPSHDRSDILIMFAKNHSVNTHWNRTNPTFTNAVVNGEISFNVIEHLFGASNGNERFQAELALYLRSQL